MLRRHFLHLLASGTLFAGLGSGTRRLRAVSSYSFRHGVASGDPLADAVIIWTRVSGAHGESVRVDWLVGSDPELQQVVQAGRFETGPRRDYTVKINVQGLPAGARLYYRFAVDGVTSSIGKTRTLPEGEVAAVSFAVVSCSNYPSGYFHAYREIAQRGDLDAVVHLGDYIYEYAPGEYGTEYAEQLGRVPSPPRELLSLADYRERYAQYRTDPDLQAMHAAHPVIAVWDDHEIANDCWRKGAENHGEGEGRWASRRDAAITAYFEWLPIRGDARGRRTRIFRDFRYGDLLSLTMLDTRVYGRDRQPKLDDGMTAEQADKVLADPKRRLLGRRQERWLRESLRQAEGTTWQVIGQQLLMSPTRAPDLEPLLDLERPSMLSREVLDHTIAVSKANPPMLLDTWDGYVAARNDLLTDLERLTKNPVVLSGDLHTSIAGDLYLPGETQPVAVEFMTTSVTSPGFAEYLPERHPGAVRDATLQLNPSLRYMETDRRGWLCMSFTKTGCTGEWHLLDGIRSQQYESTVDKRLRVSAGEVHRGLTEG